jgi:D-aminoacyl-tRNA deacylase
MKAIVVSEKDLAGMTMFPFFLEQGFKQTDKISEGKPIYERGDWMLVTIQKRQVFADSLQDLDADEIVFASKHQSASADPTLTAHAPGNFGPADLGGAPKTLCKASTQTMRNIYSEIVRCDLDYKVSLEVTHHGPCIPQPCCFVELGSSEKQWHDRDAAAFLVDCIMKGIDSHDETPAAIGIGGNHYCATLSQYEGEVAFGHICPKYAQKYLDAAMVQQMIDKTIPEPKKILIDKKGVATRGKLLDMLKHFESCDIELK